MGTLDQVTQMQAQGMTEEQIINELQQQGISPRDITNAMSQSQIKQAITNEQTGDPQMGLPGEMYSTPSLPGQTYPQTQEMQPMQGDQMYPSQQEGYPPAPQAPQENQYSPRFQQGGYEEGYQADPYAGEIESGGGYSDGLIEVAEQVFSEKIKKSQNQIDKQNEFKNIAEIKIEHMETSIKRIEKIIDKLQIAILEKVGSYGRNLDSIKKEMSMMQNSFEKMVEPVLKAASPKQNTSSPSTTHKKVSKKK